MSLGKVIPLSNGKAIPQIGLGTWLSEPNEVEQAVVWAVEAGYRHIDCAMVYGNQDEVGRALKKVIPSIVKREDLFITSKVWNTSHHPDDVEAELNETLKELETDYVDMYLIHWPVSFPRGAKPFEPPNPDKPGEVLIDGNGPSIIDTWKAMIKLLDTGKVRGIGVSNFTVDHLKAVSNATGVTPAVNQIEAHPLLPQDELRLYCAEHNIHITAYSPLGNNLRDKPRIIDHAIVKEVAEKLNATPAQVLIAWGAHRGYSVIPKSVHKDRIISNFQQITLSDADYEKITSIGKGNRFRYNTPAAYKLRWPIDIFNEETEELQPGNFQVRII